MVSANHEEQLEFFSIEVPDGLLTSRLQHLRGGDRVVVGRKPTGTLVLDNLLRGRRLYLLGTGTGLAPFLSLIKGPETYERLEKVVLVHGCRVAAELAYENVIRAVLPQDELLEECVRKQLLYFPTVTREPFRNRGRIADLISSSELFRRLELPAFDASEDRVMLCGSPGSAAREKVTARGARLARGRQCGARALRHREGFRRTLNRRLAPGACDCVASTSASLNSIC